MARKGKPENLKPFKKGKDDRRNMNGPPRKLPAIDEILADCLGDGDAAKAIIQALIKKARVGDVRAAEVLLNRAYGKAKQFIDHTTGGEAINAHAVIDYTKLRPETLKEILDATSI